jgi:hypothetical protein
LNSRRQNRPHDLAQIPAGAAEAPGGALDQRRRRIVAHEPLHQLGRDEPSGGRMRGENVEHLFAILDAAACLDPIPEDSLLALR